MGQLLKGKTVIVTGAGGGIGFATATRAYDEGAQVVATVHSEAGAQRMKVSDDRLVGRVVDVTDEQQVKDLISFTVDTFGKLDGIVNNAGILIPEQSWTHRSMTTRKRSTSTSRVYFWARSTPSLSCSRPAAARSSTSDRSTRSAPRSCSAPTPPARARC